MRSERPGLLVRWWYWRTARKYRKPDVTIGLDIEIIEGGEATMLGNDGGGSALAGTADLYDKPRHWWYR